MGCFGHRGIFSSPRRKPATVRILSLLIGAVWLGSKPLKSPNRSCCVKRDKVPAADKESAQQKQDAGKKVDEGIGERSWQYGRDGGGN